jgi:hypothetical protein
VLLSDAEVQSLQCNADPSDDVTKLVEGAIALRALLVDKCELSRTGQTIDFAPYVLFARDVLGELQRLGGMHGPRHTTIAGSAKQLWNVIQQTEKIARQTL